MDKQLRDIFSQNTLFEGLSESEQKELTSIMHEQSFLEDAIVVNEGEESDRIYIILSGLAGVFKASDDPTETTGHLIAELKPGDSIGDVTLIDKQPRSATVRALEPLKTLYFERSALESLSPEDLSLESKIKMNFARQLSQYLRNTNVNTLKERKMHESEITELTNFDVVTGLPNQHLFKKQLEELLAESPNKTHVLYQVEVEDYKELCDALGPDKGDQFISAVADRICVSLDEAHTIARVGSNQFMILFANVKNLDSIPHMAQKIIRFFAAGFMVDDEDIFTNTYIGITHYPDDGKKAEDLIKHAGLALDVAKINDPNTYSFYDMTMNAMVEERRKLINDLYKAFEDDDFELYYQPQICLKTGKLLGAEALIRWPHETRGMVSPAEFIPIVEQTGLIIKLGNWIIKMACAQAKMWEKAGDNPVRIAVNLSAIQFKQHDLIDKINAIIKETNLDPSLIELEVTEGVMMSSFEDTAAKLQSLKDAGFVIALDDFGTGYSSLSYLRKLPLHKLKVDQSFVRGMDEGDDSKDIVRCIVALAKGLHLEVIAEGIETKEHEAFLKSIACDEGQGYLYAKPLSASEFETKYLKKGN